MPPRISQDRHFPLAGALRFLAIPTCLLLGGCIFLAVHAVKAVTEKGEPRSELRQVTASPDAIVFEATADPLAFASKHCAAHGKVAVETGVQQGKEQGFATYYFSCRAKPP